MLKAKFKCYSVANVTAAGPEHVQQNVSLTPVYGTGEENKSFSKYTPAGKLEMTITNEAAFDFFKPGLEYYLDITPAGN